MRNYSIKELEHLSGVKAHTIRIWEKRYGLLKPKRTGTKIRVYDDDQLKHLLNVALLLEKGHKISKISKLKAKEIHNSLLGLYTAKGSDSVIEDKINGLVIAMIEFNTELFEKIFNSTLLGLGFGQTIAKLIYPFLQRVGIFWIADNVNPGQEHFITNLIRQKIIAAINSLPAFKESSEKFLLYLPEDELHEIGLLMASYHIQEKGHQVIYLGQDVPFKALQEAYRSCHPENILFFLTTTKSLEATTAYLKDISTSFSKSSLYVSGSKQILSSLKLPGNIKWLKGIKDLEDILKK